MKIDFRDARELRVARAAEVLEVSFDEMVYRLVDGGLAALDAVVMRWEADIGAAKVDPEPEPKLKRDTSDLEWRIVACWAAYRKAWRRFHERHDGTVPHCAEHPSPETRRMLRKALRQYDGELLGEAKREQWTKESKVRAAGIGLFMDPWFNGTAEESKGTPYLSPDYAWRQRRGAADPVEKFSALYFAAMAARAPQAGET